MSNTDARPTQVLPYTSNLDKERRGPAAAAAEGLRHMEEQAAWDEDPDAALAAQTKADDEDRRGVVSFDGSPPRGSIGALRVSARALVAEQRSHLRFGDGKVVEGPLSAAGVAIEDDLQCIDAADNRLSLKLDEASRRESFIPLYRSDFVPGVREAAAAVAEAARADRLERSFQVRGMPVVLASDERPLRDRGTLETLTDSMREALVEQRQAGGLSAAGLEAEANLQTYDHRIYLADVMDAEHGAQFDPVERQAGGLSAGGLEAEANLQTYGHRIYLADVMDAEHGAQFDPVERPSRVDAVEFADSLVPPQVASPSDDFFDDVGSSLVEDRLRRFPELAADLDDVGRDGREDRGLEM